MNERKLEFLVGDNPFHGISHLSQKRARSRAKEESLSNIENNAKLVQTCLENGASGFTFTVSETTLSILKVMDRTRELNLYPVVPYSYEYVRLATKTGGFPGLAKKVIRQIVFSKNVKAVPSAIVGSIRADPSAFMKMYLLYELSRIKHSVGKSAHIKSVILHEVITDMALALNMDWLFKSYINFMSKSKIRPGLHTRNLPYLVKKLENWSIDVNKLTILTPFNKIGFEMNPSRIDCEKVLESLSGTQLIAMSILASGYLKPSEAIDYVMGLPNIATIAVGVSSERQANETFKMLKERNLRN